MSPLTESRTWLMTTAREAGDRYYDPATERCLIPRDTCWYAISLLFDESSHRRILGNYLLGSVKAEDGTHTPATLLAILHRIPDISHRTSASPGTHGQRTAHRCRAHGMARRKRQPSARCLLHAHPRGGEVRRTMGDGSRPPPPFASSANGSGNTGAGTAARRKCRSTTAPPTPLSPSGSWH